MSTPAPGSILHAAAERRLGSEAAGTPAPGIAPGYFDLQVNGYGGTDFNQDALTPEALHHACQILRRDGVSGILATIITDHVEVMAARLARLAELRQHDELAREVIAGLHAEGPFLNGRDGYRGAHPADAIRPADTDSARRLFDAGDGLLRLVTLAPECDPDAATTAWLARQGVTVAAGHCDAPLDDLRRAVDAGLSMFTHFGNGCPRQLDRHDNILQRVLSMSDRIRLCFIADGVHIPFFALGNYLRLAGVERSIVVTDAIAPAGLGPGRYTVSRWTLDIGQDMVARSPDGSHFVGSAIHMPRAADNLAAHLGLSPDDIDALTRRNPRIAVGL